MWAAVHMHEEKDQIQRALRNLSVAQIQQIFASTQNQIVSSQQTELSGMHGQLNWDESPWMSCTLLHKDVQAVNGEGVRFLGFCAS